MTNFGDLYRHHAQDVFRFTLYLSGNHAEAEDLTAETFVRAWTGPEPIRMATVKGYLFTIARNLFLQSLRRRSRQVALPDTLPDPRESPHAHAEWSSELRSVVAALQELPEIDRAALLMRANDEMPYDEIARALGISIGAARVKVHRARLKLASVRER